MPSSDRISVAKAGGELHRRRAAGDGSGHRTRHCFHHCSSSFYRHIGMQFINIVRKKGLIILSFYYTMAFLNLSFLKSTLLYHVF